MIEAKDLLVTPGLIDLHLHVFWGVTDVGIEADLACVHRGVTTAVDAGSSGSNTVSGFNCYVVERSDTRVLAFLHISGMGLISKRYLVSLKTSGGHASKRQSKPRRCTLI